MQKAERILNRELQALNYALSFRRVRPAIDRLFKGKEISFADVGCGVSWISAGRFAEFLDSFNPKKMKLVGVNPLVSHYHLHHDFSESPACGKTEFAICSHSLDLDTVETIRRMAVSGGFDLVVTFNPLGMSRIFPLMISLLKPNGIFVASLADDNLMQTNLDRLLEIPGIEVLANRKRSVSTNWNNHLFVARLIDPSALETA